MIWEAWQEEVDSDSIRCLSLVSMSDVAETSQRSAVADPGKMKGGFPRSAKFLRLRPLPVTRD